VFIANQPDPDPAVLEARRRPHAHVEGRIRAARASGLRNLPFFDFGANDAWLTWPWSPRPWSAGRRRCCWTAAARLPSQDLRFRLWHVAGRTVRHARRLIVRIDRAWPWAGARVAAFGRLRGLPARC
jgi:hypothetical protein